MTPTPETKKETKGLAHHAKKIHDAIKPHLTRRNIITAKLAMIFGFLGHVILPKLALFKTGALAVIFGIGSAINPFGTHANIEPVCNNGTIEGAEICDGIVLANGVNIPSDVIWKCSDTCQLEINVPRFDDQELSSEDKQSIQDALAKKVKQKTYVSKSDHAVATVNVKKAPKKVTSSIPKKEYAPVPIKEQENTVKTNIQTVKKATEINDDDLANLLHDLTKEDDIPQNTVPSQKVIPQDTEDDSLESLLKDITKE